MVHQRRANIQCPSRACFCLHSVKFYPSQTYKFYAVNSFLFFFSGSHLKHRPPKHHHCVLFDGDNSPPFPPLSPLSSLSSLLSLLSLLYSLSSFFGLPPILMQFGCQHHFLLPPKRKKRERGMGTEREIKIKSINAKKRRE